MDQSFYDAIPTANHPEKHGRDTRPKDPPDVQVLPSPDRTCEDEPKEKTPVSRRDN